jgi:hypothetical protein
VAYYPDWSGLAVFAEEIHALRYAVDHAMSCEFVPFGVDVRESVSEQYRERAKSTVVAHPNQKEGK